MGTITLNRPKPSADNAAVPHGARLAMSIRMMHTPLARSSEARRSCSERPIAVATPRSLEDVCSMVRAADAANLRITPAGTCWSFSNIDASPGIVMRSSALDGIEAVDAASLTYPEMARELISVEAGATVAAVSLSLLARGRALATMGASTGMSVGGAIATSTHGSGLGVGPMCDGVVSCDVVVGGGRALRIEPVSGPTDPARFSHPLLTLVKDDDVFHSVVAGVGAMGFVHRLTLRTVEDTVLEERRSLSSFEDLRERLRDLAFLGSFRDVAVLINPYARRGRHLASFTCIREVEAQRARSPSRHNVATRLIGRAQPERWLARALELAPGMIPIAIDAALHSLAGTCFVGASSEVLAGTPLTEAVRAHVLEASVALDDIVATVEGVLDIAHDEARSGRFLTAPFTVRFVAPSRHLLSPHYERASATIEMISLAGEQSDGDELAPYASALVARGGRMHLGLDTRHARGDRRLLENIPRLTRWRAVAEDLDPQRTFVHRAVVDLGLR